MNCSLRCSVETELRLSSIGRCQSASPISTWLQVATRVGCEAQPVLLCPQEMAPGGRMNDDGGVLNRAELAVLVHLRRARDLMDREYAKPLDVPALARHALMSPAHFSRQFKAAFGETPHGYLMTRRIERAMALLRAGSSVTNACVAVGCTSLGSFSASFRAVTGETPSDYSTREHGALDAMPSCVARLACRPSRQGRPAGAAVGGASASRS